MPKKLKTEPVAGIAFLLDLLDVVRSHLEFFLKALLAVNKGLIFSLQNSVFLHKNIKVRLLLISYCFKQGDMR